MCAYEKTVKPNVQMTERSSIQQRENNATQHKITLQSYVSFHLSCSGDVTFKPFKHTKLVSLMECILHVFIKMAQCNASDRIYTLIYINN